MIPYVIEQANPSDYLKDSNIITTYYSSEKDKLDKNIIISIIDIIYEFCSDEYGYGIKIISYNDFCYQYWKIKQIKMDNFYIFNIKYFENNWKNWNVEDYKEEIYISYVKKFSI
jgi:hypothetical protein